MSETRILIVDDHPLFRRGVRQLVEMDPDMVIAGEASNGIEAAEVAGTLDLDLILMDMNMAKMDGLEALRQMRSNGTDTRIVMLTVSDADDDVVAALRREFYAAPGALCIETLMRLMREHRGPALRAVCVDFADPAVSLGPLHFDNFGC